MFGRSGVEWIDYGYCPSAQAPFLEGDGLLSIGGRGVI
jgi:hypothetical protein